MSSVSLVSPPDQEYLVRRHLPLAHHVVADVMSRIPRHVPRDELVSAALLGLVQAARTFDPDRGVGFERHARSRMRGAVLDDLRSRDWASRSTRARARHRREVDEEFAMTFGRTPTPSEAAERMGLSSSELARLDDDVHRATVLSYDTVFTTAEESEAFLAPDADPALAVLERERLTQVMAAVAALPPRMRRVVVGVFFESRRLIDIADELGVTESRVCQMKHEALSQLRRRLGASIDLTEDRTLAAAAC
ncbi:MAG: sigma-70 family RNA polymerase sigma factor [Acidimicrobiia bacterium]